MAKKKKSKNKFRGVKSMLTANTVIGSFTRDRTLESNAKVIRALVFVFQGTLKSLKWVITDSGVCEISMWGFTDGSFISYSRFVSGTGKVNLTVKAIV